MKCIAICLVLALGAAGPALARDLAPIPAPRPPAPLSDVVDVVDGDTFHARPSAATPACTRLRYGMWESIRILGLDTPEMRGKCAAERRQARAAKARTTELLSSGRVTIERAGCDRYQRTLARVLVDGRDVAETLIGEGLGRPYEGGRRAGWCEGE